MWRQSVWQTRTCLYCFITVPDLEGIGPNGGSGALFNQGSRLEARGAAGSLVLCLNSSFGTLGRLCTCPKGNAGTDYDFDGEFSCIIEPANLAEWAARLAVAAGLACLMLVLRCIVERASTSSMPAAVPEEMQSLGAEELSPPRMSHQDDREIYLKAARLSVVPAMPKERGEWWPRGVLLHAIGRAVLHIMLPPTLAWFCPWSYVISWKYLSIGLPNSLGTFCPEALSQSGQKSELFVDC